MTKHTNFPTPGTESENVLTFPDASDAPHRGEHPARDDHMPDGMPDGFLLLDDGIYQLRPGDDEDLEPVKICSPLIVTGQCRRSDGTGWGRVVRVQDPDGGWHELILEARDISASPAKIVTPLVDLGLVLSSAAKVAQSVKDLLGGWQPATRYDRVNHLGWVDGEFSAFTLGDGHVIGDGLVATDSVPEELMTAIHTRGTLEAWKAEVAAGCVGNPLMMLAVSQAFTGPLLSVLGQTGGGFHLRGESSRGKSTIQYVATSVWGARPLLQSWDGTPSGFEGIAAACNDTLLNIEELHKADPRTVGDIVYMLANGEGRLRARSNGKLQTPQRWRVPVLSSGEVSLEEHMASAGRKIFAGQEVRLINLEADGRSHGAFDDMHGETTAKAFAERIDRACYENYGHAGPQFVEAVMRNTSKLSSWQNVIDSICRDVAKKADLSPGDGAAQRVLKRFAIAALAGELATKHGLTDWPKGAVWAAAREMFLEWFEDREGTTNEEIATAVQRTRDYVSQNLDRFQAINTTDHDPIDGWRDQDWIYILPECWRAIHGENDPSEMARLHKEEGLLKTHKGGGLQFKMPRKIQERPRVYAVHTSKLLGTTEV